MTTRTAMKQLTALIAINHHYGNKKTLTCQSFSDKFRQVYQEFPMQTFKIYM